MYDRIYLEGFLDYRTIKSSDGKEIPAAYIAPTFIIKLKTVRRADQSKEVAKNSSDYYRGDFINS